MAFDKAYLKLKKNNPRGIPDEYTYWGRDDTIAEITATGYFDESAFAPKEDPRRNLTDPPDTDAYAIHVQASDGPYEVQLVGGVASVVSGSPIELSANSVGARPQAGFDNADAIELAASRIKEGKITFDSGEYEIHRTIYIPVGVWLEGKSGSRGFDDDANATVFKSVVGGSYVEDFLFFMNIDPDGDTTTWVKQFPNNDSGGAMHVHIDGTATGGIHGFKFGGSHVFRHITATKIGSIIRKPSGLYTDKLEISQIHAIERSDDTSWFIDLPGLGDGYIISNIAPAYLNLDGTGITNGVNLGACRSGQLINLINGRHMINGAKSVEVVGCHIEGGNFTFKDCSAHIRDGIMFCEEDVDGQIITDSDNGTFGNRYTLKISNMIFDQSMNRRGGFQATARPDVVCSQYFDIQIVDCKRKITDSSNVAMQQYTGILCGTDTTTMLDDFNNYSHVLSRKCNINGQRVNKTFDIVSQFRTFGGITGVTEAVDSATYQGPTGTYYYQGQILQDPIRMMGRGATLGEVSLALTNGSDLAKLSIGWNLVENKTDVILRVYKGVSTGSYNQYVDIPLLNASFFYDDGNAINGYVWKSRTASGVSSLNGGINGAIRSLDGVITSFTDGANATVGTWSKGDLLIKRNPTLGGGGTTFNARFLRLTDGSAHVKNTDWLFQQDTQG